MKAIFTFLLIFIYSGISTAKSSELKFNDGKFVVTWTLADDEKSIFFKIDAESAGWIALGFTETGNRMNDADIIIGQVDAANATNLQIGDFYSTKPEPPHQDDVSNVRDEKGWRNITEGTAHMEFRKLLDTGDKAHDQVIPLTGTYILWARSNSETIKDGGHGRGKAGQTKEIVVFKANIDNDGAPAQAISLVVALFILVSHHVVA